MDKSIVDKIVKTIFDFLGKKVSEEVQKPVAPIQMAEQSPQKSGESAPQSPQNLIDPITKDDILMGRDKLYPSDYTKDISDNLDKLLSVLNKIQEAYGKKFKINSGWRPAIVNASVPGAAVHSKHTEGLAVDIADKDGDIMRWTLANLQFMKELGVHMEDWRWTPSWTHYQCVPPKSGNRIFIPSTSPALAPDRWEGKYLSKYN